MAPSSSRSRGQSADELLEGTWDVRHSALHYAAVLQSRGEGWRVYDGVSGYMVGFLLGSIELEGCPVLGFEVWGECERPSLWWSSFTVEWFVSMSPRGQSQVYICLCRAHL